jgi:hypothetical protein
MYRHGTQQSVASEAPCVKCPALYQTPPLISAPEAGGADEGDETAERKEEL